MRSSASRTKASCSSGSPSCASALQLEWGEPVEEEALRRSLASWRVRGSSRSWISATGSCCSRSRSTTTPQRWCGRRGKVRASSRRFRKATFSRPRSTSRTCRGSMRLMRQFCCAPWFRPSLTAHFARASRRERARSWFFRPTSGRTGRRLQSIPMWSSPMAFRERWTKSTRRLWFGCTTPTSLGSTASGAMRRTSSRSAGVAPVCC